MSKINEIYSLKLEYSLYSRYLGKVLVIVGPKSSGKTDIVEKITLSIPNCYSINRKILAYEAMNKNDKIFLENLLQEATKVTGIKIINGQQLFHIELKNNVDVSTLSRFSQIKQEFYRIIGTETFKQSYKILLFSSYFDEIKKYIFSGRHIVIDEGSIESEKDFEIFHYCFGYYKEVKKALLFNKIEDTLIKCMIRNNKFVDSLNGSSCKNMQEFTVTDIIKKNELKTGGSSSIYREPKEIIKNYHKYYSFKKRPTDIAIEITYYKLYNTLSVMATEQFKLIGFLLYKNVINKISSASLIDLTYELSKIFSNKNSPQVKAYMIPKMRFDFIIDLTKHMDHQGVNNTPSYILLQDILTWLGIDSRVLKGINSLNLVAKGTIPEYIFKAGIESMFYKLHSAIQDSYSTNLVWLHLKEILNEKTEFIIKHLDQEIQFFHYNPNGCLLEDSPSAKSGITAFYLTLQKSSFKNDVIPIIIDLNHTNNFVKLKELHKIILDTALNTEHLVREWKIWSKCFGKVIIINGASCSGKSTLVSYLKKSGFYGITIDDVYDQHYLNYLNSIIQDKIDLVEKLLPREDFWKVLLNFKIDSSQYEEYQRNYIDALADYLRDNSNNIKEHCPEPIEIYKIIYSQASTFIFSGINVVVDLIMHDNEINTFSSAFNYYPICTYLLYSPLKDNLVQCFWRNYCCFKKTETLKDIDFDPRTSSYVLKKYTELYEYRDKPASVRIKINLENTQSCEELRDIFNYAILDTYNIYYSLYRDCDSNSFLKEVKQIKQYYYSTVASNKAYIIPTFNSDYLIDTANGKLLKNSAFINVHRSIPEIKQYITLAMQEKYWKDEIKSYIFTALSNAEKWLPGVSLIGSSSNTEDSLEEG